MSVFTSKEVTYFLKMSSWTSCRFSRSSEGIQRSKQIVDAAEKGDCVEIRKLLETGVSVNAEEYNKSLFYESKNYVTPLQVAAANGNAECVQILIEANADLNARDRFDVTAVHMAAERGQRKCLVLLLDAGADCNIATKYSKAGCYTATPHPGGTTPLHLAAASNHVPCVKELIQNGADYNSVDELGRTSLYVAAEAGFEEAVLVHLRNAIGKDILSLPVTKSGETPLHCCVKLGMKKCVKELLDHGSDVNHRNHAGFSPLHCSVFHILGKEKQSLEITKTLVLNGYNADINLAVHSGMTPLHFVSFSDGSRMERRSEAAAFLVAYGANTDISDRRRNSLMLTELQNGSDRTILQAVIKSLPVLPTLVSLNLTKYVGPSRGASSLALAIGGAGDAFPRGDHFNLSCTRWAKIQWYKQLSESPRSLQHWCRFVIRKALGYKRLKLVHRLPISNNLMDYLLLEYNEFK